MLGNLQGLLTKIQMAETDALVSNDTPYQVTVLLEYVTY